MQKIESPFNEALSACHGPRDEEHTYKVILLVPEDFPEEKIQMGVERVIHAYNKQGLADLEHDARIIASLEIEHDSKRVLERVAQEKDIALVIVDKMSSDKKTLPAVCRANNVEICHCGVTSVRNNRLAHKNGRKSRLGLGADIVFGFGADKAEASELPYHLMPLLDKLNDAIFRKNEKTFGVSRI